MSRKLRVLSALTFVLRSHTTRHNEGVLKTTMVSDASMLQSLQILAIGMLYDERNAISAATGHFDLL